MTKNEPRRIVVQAPPAPDAVLPTQHLGETAYVIRFKGETLQMLWGVRSEAEDNLRALRGEITPAEIHATRTTRAAQAKAFAAGAALGHRVS